MSSSPENVKTLERFLTPELFRTLSAAAPSPTDYFTGSDTPPKTFKIAKCTEQGAGKADVVVQIYWRQESGKVDQRELHVDATKSDDTWLVNKVSN